MTRLMKAVLGGTAIAGLLAGGGALAYRRFHPVDPLVVATQLIGDGNVRAALLPVRTAIGKQPNDPALHLIIADLHMKMADAAAAEKEYLRAAALGADRRALLPQMGEALVAQGRYADTLRLQPRAGMAPADLAKLLLLRAIAHLALDEPLLAGQEFARARREVPNEPDTLLIAARLAAARNDVEATEANVAAVLRRKPDQVEALLMQEQLVSAKGDHAAALALANRAVDAAPWSAMARIDRAYQLMFAGQDQAAQSDVDAVLAGQPRFIDAIFLTGILMARRGEFADASTQLAQLDTVGARFPQAILYKGRVALELGQTEAAADLARRYFRAVPADPDGVRLLAQTALLTRQASQRLPDVERAVAKQATADAPTLQLLGRMYSAAGNWAAARRTFERAVAVTPDDPTILTDLGEAELRTGDPVKSVALLEQARRPGETPGVADALLVRAALGSNDFAKAGSVLETMRAKLGETEVVGTLTGLYRLQRDDLEGARDAWAAVAKAFPKAVEARYQLGRLMVQQGRVTEGISQFKQVLKAQPANATALGAYLQEMVRQKDVTAAMQALEAARAAEPNNLVFASMLADTWTATGSPAKAVTLLTSLRGQDEMPQPLLMPMGRALMAASQPSEAAMTFQAATRAQPMNVAAWSGYIEALQRMGNRNAVAAALRDNVRAMPGDLVAMSNVIVYENTVNGLDGALKAAEELRADPANMPNAAILKGDLLVRAGQPADAARAYEAEYAAGPTVPLLMRLSAADVSAGRDDAATRRLRAWLAERPGSVDAARTLAQIDIRAERFDDAQTHLAVVLAARPNDPQALNNLAWTYYLAHDPRARAAAAEAYLKAPSPDTADTLGWITAEAGAVAEAIPLLRNASLARPADQGIRYHLAVALQKDGQVDEAVRALKRLVNDGDASYRAAAERMLKSLPPPK